MLTFIRAQAAAMAATCFDFLVTIVLERIFGCWYLFASITGTIAGGVLNFIMGRHWAFRAADRQPGRQFLRYGLVWTGNLLLNAGGTYLLTQYTGCSYVFSKLLTSVTVAVGYNYVLQNKFVFR